MIISGSVKRVLLRVKAHPVFVSDAMDKDCRDTIDAMILATASTFRKWEEDGLRIYPLVRG